MIAQATFAFLALLALVDAHLYLKTPPPIPGNAIKDPLAADGSNFPCHGVNLAAGASLGDPQSMAAGSSQALAWELGITGENTAVHGGGSCQISLTYETDAEKVKDPKNWFVIYSIEEGCPSNTVGNLDGEYLKPGNSQDQTYTGAYVCSNTTMDGLNCVNEFSFDIPKGIKDGPAIMAWTWFNTVGNREMYMNCISTELSGGDGSEMSSLPNMFVANVGQYGNYCNSDTGSALKFPDPGQYVTTKMPSGPLASTATTYALKIPTASACAAQTGSGGDSSPGTASAAPSSSATSAGGYGSASASQTAAASAPTDTGSAPADSNAPITITTLATVTGLAPTVSAAATSKVESGPAASTTTAAAPTATAAPDSSGSTSSSTSSGNCSNGEVSCTESLVCIGTTQFGLCNNGCAVPQDLAAGTTCSGGSISKRQLSRHMRRPLDRL